MATDARPWRRLVPPPGPLRVLAMMNLANSAGDGAFAAVSVVFLVRVVHLSTAPVTAGMAVAGCVALLLGVPAGLLADRVGPTGVYRGLCLIEGLSVAAYPLIGNVATFAVLVCLGTSASRATAGVRNGMIARLIEPTSRVPARAYLRSVTNTGGAIGAGIAALPLAFPSRLSMSTVFEADAITFVAAALLSTRLNPPTSRPSSTPVVRGLLGDWRFLIASLMQALLSLHSAILTVALPLWIVTRTAAPAWLVGVVLVGSTVGSVLLQVPTSRWVGSARATTLATWISGCVIAAACVVLSWTGTRHAAVAALLIGLAACVRLVGELLQSAAGWSMSAAAPPPGHESTYQAVYSTGFTAAAALGPALSGWVVSSPGGSGWLSVAAVFAIVGGVAATAGRLVVGREAAL